MSKITVRADEDLVERLDAREESKSQLVREALRAYLDEEPPVASSVTVGRDADVDDAGDAPTAGAVEEDVADGTLDAVLEDRVMDLVDRRVESYLQTRQQDVNVNVNVEGGTTEPTDSSDEPVATSPVSDDGVTARTCNQCGDALDGDHVYCPNCGEKASRRVFCDCGDEIRSDWAFCPGCGRRTPAADVLDST
ncbi:double zinc ribbon domain-containing protein [Haloarchaeobius sp. HRN-SO-5]|uniref:double zinc ribbon domain-containing protein n=1 Tax=Haloarchaeobius sp. HRN-SO-5 TaxID=3446118 RepID=UPI003EB6C0C8